MTSIQNDIASIIQRVDERSIALRDRTVALTSVVSERIREKTDIIGKIGFSQTYIDHKDEVIAALSSIQEKTQLKTKQFFEDLLTQLVHEVLPNENGRIVFDSKIKSNKPFLDVCIEKDGKLEGVFEDNGGALTNVVSMGLRFIALSRSGNRKFLLFDEADAWIKPDNVALFMNVISQMSHKLDVQCLVISHHEQSLMPEGAKIINLSKDDQGFVLAQEISGAESQSSHSCIKSIRLRGFKSHTNTLFELSPHVTIIRGENNIGKSHIARGINALRECQTSDRNINHGANFCRVELTFDDGSIMSWEYHRKGKRKTRYEMISSDNTLLESSDEGNKVPDWLKDYLFMEDVAGFDVHVMDQKNPVFLIGAGITGTQRAEILALDVDQQYIQKMLKRHNELTREHQSNIRSLKKRLKYIEKDLKVIRGVEFAIQLTIEADKKLVSIKESEGVLETINTVSNSLEKLGTYTQKLKAKVKILEAIDAPDSLHDLLAIKETCLSFKRLEKRIEIASAMINMDPLLEVKDLNKLHEMKESVQRIERLQKLESLLSLEDSKKIDRVMDDVSLSFGVIEQCKRIINLGRQQVMLSKLSLVLPDDELASPAALFDIEEIRRYGKAQAKLIGDKKRVEGEILSATKDIKQVEQEIEAAFESNGGMCPVCHQHVGEHHGV